MIAVIDYSMGNLKSVSKALVKVGGDVVVTSNPQVAKEAHGIVLPGVGAFAQGIRNLESRGFLPLLSEWEKTNKPLLGLCLGMHLLFTEGEEGGLHRGLDFMQGRVKRLPDTVKVPHMGWNQVSFTGEREDPYLRNIADGSYFYFAHSYYGEPDDAGLWWEERNMGFISPRWFGGAVYWACSFTRKKAIESDSHCWQTSSG